MLQFAVMLTGVHSEEIHCCLLPHKKKLPSLVFTTVNTLLYSGSMKGLISSLPESRQIVSLVLGALSWVEGGPGCFLLSKGYRYCFHSSVPLFLL